MNENEKLRNIKEIDYDKYVDISSLEKMATYAIKYLEDNLITTTWTNVVIATYKLFPRKFAISEDFLDFPNSERINRTLMHLVPPKGRNYAIGSSKVDYKLTPLGKEIALAVEQTISKEAIVKNRKQEIISSVKTTNMTAYSEINNSNEFKVFKETGKYTIDMIWTLYHVIPFTQKEKIINKMNKALEYAKNNNDLKCIDFINKMLFSIQ